jgi:hypothetical protein
MKRYVRATCVLWWSHLLLLTGKARRGSFRCSRPEFRCRQAVQGLRLNGGVRIVIAVHACALRLCRYDAVSVTSGQTAGMFQYSP